MMKHLLSTVITYYHDLSVSRRSIICLPLRQITDLLATEKSKYFAQPRQIIVKYYFQQTQICYNIFNIPKPPFPILYLQLLMHLRESLGRLHFHLFYSHLDNFWANKKYYILPITTHISASVCVTVLLCCQEINSLWKQRRSLNKIGRFLVCKIITKSSLYMSLHLSEAYPAKEGFYLVRNMSPFTNKN